MCEINFQSTMNLYCICICTNFHSFRMLEAKKLHAFEVAQLANLCPESSEEAKTLIPRHAILFATSVRWLLATSFVPLEPTVYSYSLSSRSLEGRCSDAELQAILEELMQKRSFDFQSSTCVMMPLLAFLFVLISFVIYSFENLKLMLNLENIIIDD